MTATKHAATCRTEPRKPQALKRADNVSSPAPVVRKRAAVLRIRGTPEEEWASIDRIAAGLLARARALADEAAKHVIVPSDAIEKRRERNARYRERNRDAIRAAEQKRRNAVRAQAAANPKRRLDVTVERCGQCGEPYLRADGHACPDRGPFLVRRG